MSDDRFWPTLAWLLACCFLVVLLLVVAATAAVWLWTAQRESLRQRLVAEELRLEAMTQRAIAEEKAAEAEIERRKTLEQRQLIESLLTQEKRRAETLAGEVDQLRSEVQRLKAELAEHDDEQKDG